MFIFSFVHLIFPQVIINYFNKWKTLKYSYKNFTGWLDKIVQVQIRVVELRTQL